MQPLIPSKRAIPVFLGALTCLQTIKTTSLIVTLVAAATSAALGEEETTKDIKRFAAEEDMKPVELLTEQQLRQLYNVGRSSIVSVGEAVNLGSTWAETTVAAYGPGEHLACPNGRLLFCDGYRVLATTLEGDTESFPGNPWSPPFNENPAPDDKEKPFLIYDNHLVKLKGGDLLFTQEGITWNDNVASHPDWWNQTQACPLKDEDYTIPGGRAIIYVYRSSDCGKTWNHATDIDAATLPIPDIAAPHATTVGLVGPPRIKKGGKMCAGGGWDGHYLYADPYTEYIFLATPAAYGTGVEGEEKNMNILLVSKDKGASWKVIGRLDEVENPTDAERLAFWRAPITSLPNGQVALAYKKGLDVLLCTFAVGSDWVDLGSTKKVMTLVDESKPEGAKINTNVWGYRSLGRNVNENGFHISSPLWVERTPVLSHRLVFAGAMSGTPSYMSLIRARDELAHTLHGTFIEGLPREHLSVFFWRELEDGIRPGKIPIPFEKYAIRFQVYNGKKALLTRPGTLTVQQGKSYAWEWPYDCQPQPPDHTPKCFVGDYMGGAVYRNRNPRFGARLADDGIRHFVAAWSQEGKLYFNTVSVKLGSEKKKVDWHIRLEEVRPRKLPPPIEPGNPGEIEIPRGD